MFQNAVEKWRANFAPTVDGNRHKATVWVDPLLVAPARRKPSARALGMHDFGAVFGQSLLAGSIVVGDHLKNIREFG